MIKPSVDYRQFRFSRLNTPEFSHVWLLLYWPLFGLGFSYVERFYTFLQCPDKFHFRKFQSAENTHEKQQQLPLPAHHSYHTCHDTYLKAAVR